MDYRRTASSDAQSCLTGIDQMAAEKPSLLSPDEVGFVRLTVEENEEMREFLDSATRISANKFDLREGFYSETQPAASWHCLSDDEITARHRMGVFPHTWQPLSAFDPSAGRHRSSHRPSPRCSGNETSLRTGNRKSETSGADVDDASEIPLSVLDKSRSCNVVLSESLLSSDFLGKDSYFVDAVTADDSLVKQVLPTDLEKNVLNYNGASPSEMTNTIMSASTLPSAVLYQTEQLEDGDLLSVKSEGDVSSPLLLKQRPTAEEMGELETSQPRVSFFLGADVDDLDIPEPPKFSQISERNKYSARHSKSRRLHSHGRQRRHHGPDLQLSDRRRLGSEVCFGDAMKQIPTEMEEALTLDDIHLHGIASHRFDDSKGIRRRKISHHAALASVIHISPVKKVRTAPILPRCQATDLQFHQHKMFVELDELRVGDNEEWAWHEKARWIKFEEDVEENAQRWGKPHVSSLSFHSLLELRRCIESAAILLDLDASDLPSIATSVVDHLVNIDQLDREVQDQVLKALLLKHSRNSSSHFKDTTDTSSSILSKVTSLPTTTVTASHLDPQLKDKSLKKEVKKRQTTSTQAPHVKFKEGNIDLKIRSNPSVRSLLSVLSPKPMESPGSLRHAESHILKRIPDGAEATNVLVGAVNFLDHPVMAFVRLLNACHLGNLTEVPLPVRFIFVLMGPENSSLDFHEIGRSLSTLMADPTFHDIAYGAESRQDLLDALNTFLNDSIVLPPGEWDKKTLLPIMEKTQQNVLKKKKKERQTMAIEKPDDPLKRTGRLFGGLINDVKRRYPLYLSDVKDGLNLQCVATFFFVYFACLSPAITFGGLLGDKTDNWMGVSEMLISTSICGVVFSLLSGQPLIIIGATGPVLVFEEALYKMCSSFEIDFLSFRFWVSLWIAAIVIVVVMVEGSFLVHYITRFTEEIFASLISLIFIYEVFKNLVLIFQRNPLQKYYPVPLSFNSCSVATDFNGTSNGSEFSDGDGIQNDDFTNWFQTSSDNSSQQSNFSNNCEDLFMNSYRHPNTALLSLILTFGTFLMAHYLKNFRNSQFLGRSARRAIGDFGVPITIIVMVLIDYLIPETYIKKLDVPDGIQPTAPDKRPWFINPVGVTTSLPVWMMLAAIIPAFLVFILLFMEAQITSMIINKKDRKLKKGSGYHLDLFLIGILSSVSGLLGVPFMCSATVRSVTHVSALSVFSRTHAPGEKPQLLEVKEQRLTSLAVHVMIGISVLLGPVLRQVPLPVLFGIFLYMGIASMSGIQMLNRVRLMFMPVKHHPDVGYARRVRLAKMNLYTLIQLACLGILWAIKSTQAALAFPFVLILMVPIRLHVVQFLFSQQELQELDRSEECESGDEDDEPDFYTQAHMPI